MNVLYGIGFALWLAASPQGAAETVFSADFNEEVPNTPPLGAIIVGNPGMIAIVDRATTPSDPFGPEDNRSLRLQKLAEDRAPRATWSFEGIESGTLSFKAYCMENDEFQHPLLNVFLCQDSTAQIGPAFWFAKDAVFVLEPDRHIHSFAFDDVWKNGKPNSVTVRFSVDKTYSLEINGQPFPDANTRFRFANEDAALINKVQFAIADAQLTGSQVFVDDIRLKKE